MIHIPVKTIHFNKPQLKVMAINANETYVVAGRAMGKSQGILAPHDYRCLQLMPRGCGMLIGSNFRKMMSDLIPPYVAGLQRLGLVRGEEGCKKEPDFVIGESDIPRRFGWPTPYIAPEKGMRKFFLHTRWGSGIRFASQDRKVTMNGTEVDWIKGDEAKLLDYDRFKKEILPTNRGRAGLWGNIPEHHSILFTTDKLFDRKGGDWIMQQRNRMDPEQIKQILQMQAYIYTIEEKYNGVELPNEVALQLNEYKRMLTESQLYAVAFIEADTLDNIHAIGWRQIMQFKNSMTEGEFNSSILNMDKQKIEGSFYPNLDYNTHGYSSADYSRIDSTNYNFDKIKDFNCLDDPDCNINQDLEISIDWGGHINCMIIFQETVNEFRVLNALYTKPPATYKDLAIKFSNYYRFHKTKTVYMWYDPSGNNARADSAQTYAEEFAATLRLAGWNVIPRNTIATNPYHHDKHLLWQYILTEKDTRLPKFRMNINNCEDVFTSMLNAPLNSGPKGFEKDKSSERKASGILPEHATHFSDTVDIPIWGKYKSILKGNMLSMVS